MKYLFHVYHILTKLSNSLVKHSNIPALTQNVFKHGLNILCLIACDDVWENVPLFGFVWQTKLVIVGCQTFWFVQTCLMFDAWQWVISFNFDIFCTSHRYKVYSRDQHVLKKARLFYFCEVGFSFIYTFIFFSFHFVAFFWPASCV